MTTTTAINLVQGLEKVNPQLWEIIARRLCDEVLRLRDELAQSEHELQHIKNKTTTTTFIPLTKEQMKDKPNCDMLTGPCSCGAWHESGK